MAPPNRTHLQIPSSQKLPLVFFEEVPFLKGNLDGRECYFLLDTGAPHLFLHRPFLPEEALIPSGEVMGVAGKVPCYRARVERLVFGEWEMGPLEAMVLEGSGVHDFSGGPLAGTLGFRELIHHAWMVDFQEKILHLWQHFEPKDHPVVATLSIQYRNHLPLVQASMAGIPLRLLLDTGCSGLVLDTRTKDQLNGLASNWQEDTVIGAGGHSTPVDKALLPQLELGPHSWPEITATFADLQGLQQRVGDFDGIVGAPLLSRTRAVVSWERKRMYLLGDG